MICHRVHIDGLLSLVLRKERELPRQHALMLSNEQFDAA
jgi:hypothetical protein